DLGALSRDSHGLGPVCLRQSGSGHRRVRAGEALGGRHRRSDVEDDCPPRADQRRGRLDRSGGTRRSVVTDQNRLVVHLHHWPPCHFPELCTSSNSSPSASIWASTPWRAARSASSPLSTVSHLSVRACRPGKAWSSVSLRTPRTRISYRRGFVGSVIALH